MTSHVPELWAGTLVSPTGPPGLCGQACAGLDVSSGLSAPSPAPRDFLSPPGFFLLSDDDISLKDTCFSVKWILNVFCTTLHH